MGNDGGSIARRDELVKVKAGPSKQDPSHERRARWALCRLSRQPLKEPVVADDLGRMYNKEAVVNWLIDRKVREAKGQGFSGRGGLDADMAHVRGLKDLTTLKLQANTSTHGDSTTPKSESTSGLEASSNEASFVCPLTNRPMNGSHRFVFLRTSGAVMSESGLRAVMSPNSSTTTQICPVTSVAFEPGTGLSGKQGGGSTAAAGSSAPTADPLKAVGDVIVINPGPPEEETQRAAMAARRKQAVQDKKKAKASSSKESDDAGREKRKRAAADVEEATDKEPLASSSSSSAPSLMPANDAKVLKRPHLDGDATEARADLDVTPSTASATKDHSHYRHSADTVAAIAAREAKRKEAPLSSSTLKSIYGSSS